MDQQLHENSSSKEQSSMSSGSRSSFGRRKGLAQNPRLTRRGSYYDKNFSLFKLARDMQFDNNEGTPK